MSETLIRLICQWFVQFSSVAQLCLSLCDTHGLQHTRLPCPSPAPRVCSNPCPSSQWCRPTISSSVSPSSSFSSFNISQHQGLFQWVRSSHQLNGWWMRGWVGDWLMDTTISWRTFQHALTCAGTYLPCKEPSLRSLQLAVFFILRCLPGLAR